MMKIRAIISALLLGSSFLLYLLVSGAPPRVHMALALTWIPSVAALLILFWAHRISIKWKILVAPPLIVLGSILVNLGLSLTVGKFDIGFIGIAAHAALLAVGSLGLLAVTSLVIWLNDRWKSPSKQAG